MTFKRTVFIGVLLLIINLELGEFSGLFDCLGCLVIIYAFMNTKQKYARLGTALTAILFGLSSVLLFEPHFQQAVLEQSEYGYSFSAELFKIAYNACMILMYACIFAVANEIKPLTGKLLPIVLFTTLILYEVIGVFAYYLSANTLETIYLPLFICSILAHVAFLIFLLERNPKQTIVSDMD